MNKLRCSLGWLKLLCAIAVSGCSPAQPFFLHEDGDLSHYLDSGTEIEYPDLNDEPLPDAAMSEKPSTTEDPDDKERWKLSLEEVLSIALQNSQVLRSLGGRVYQPVGQSAGTAPETLTLNSDFAPTTDDPAIQETSNTGVEAALANFDAQLQSRLTWDRSDRPTNILPNRTNIFQPTLQRDFMNYQAEISKRSASGSQWFFRNITQYDANNTPLTQRPNDPPGSGIRALYSEWFTSFEMEVRHPLLRGSGVQTNRVPVMLARLNTDIAISDFEINVRDFVLELERAYWDLYYHYHQLDAARTGFASALAIWKNTQNRTTYQLEGGDAANEAQSRAQYFAFRARLQQAKSDLLHQESRLRFLMGLAASDGRLIQPTDQPTKARVAFDWYDVKNEALVRRPELRRQKWRLKQQQLQLIAARNQLLPQLDAIALYRFLGLGDDLGRLGSRFGGNFPDRGSLALDNLFEGDFTEWQLGFQYQMPFGNRAEKTQVRNAQLQLRRAEKRLDDLELEVVHQLNHAVRRLRDSYQIAQTQFNTVVAYRDQVQSAETAYLIAQTAPLDVVLDAQSNLAQAEIDYFRALTEYNLSIAEVHHRKGSLLEYNGVMLAEGPWPSKAYFDAHTRARQRDASYYLNYGYSRPAVVSQGAFTPAPAQRQKATPTDTSETNASSVLTAEDLGLEGPLNLPRTAEDPIYGSLDL